MNAPVPETRLPFRKMHGLGNDFCVIDARRVGRRVTPALVRAIGDRHRGVGFDQLVEILPADGGAQAGIAFWNPDGSQAQACGNATRCVADLLMRESASQALVLAGPAGPLAARRRPDGLMEVNMGPPQLDWRAIPLSEPEDPLKLPIQGDPVALGMGNPHCVFFVPEAGVAPVETLGPRIERHALFPERTNVEFVQVLGPHHLRLRVWERGAGVTLACGSGACAAAVAAHRRGLVGECVTVTLDGGDLEIAIASDGVLMAGPVAHVFDGVFDPAFIAAAEAPA